MNSSDEYGLAPLVPDGDGVGKDMHCPNCHAKLKKSAVLCTTCGYHFISRQVLTTQSQPTPESAEPANTQSSSQNRTIDLCIRVFGWSWLGLPACYLIFFAMQLVATRGLLTVLGTMGLIVTAFIGFLGFIVGRNGAEFGREANSIRASALIYLIMGAVVFAASLAMYFAFLIADNRVVVVGVVSLAGLMAGAMIGAVGLAIVLMGKRLSDSSL